MMQTKRVLAILTITGFALVAPVSAQSPETPSDENIFVMGGPFSASNFGETLLFWQDQYESNFFAGIGYQKFIHSYGSFQFGFEAGLGLRLGTTSSAEAWGGGVIRLTEFEIGALNIVPAVTAGFSVVTDTIGVEAERADASGKSGTLLYYLGPEIAFSYDTYPEWEAFGRVQHRSGGYGTITDYDGSNAATLGIRYKF